jgi:ABC-type uncharacterized transport system substrate-binding protein
VLVPVLVLTACGGSQMRSASVTVNPMPDAARQVRTALLVSDDTPDYQLVAEEIMRRLPAGTYEVLHLEGNAFNTPDVLEDLDHFEPDQLIAVGLLAAITARRRPDLPLVFCRVFNHRGNDLLSSNSAGVNLLPPFDLQLAAWKALDPNLQQIGVIGGPGQQGLIEEISTSASRQNIQIRSLTVSSDKEALFKYKRLIPLVDGVMVLPDNRILSVAVLEELMSYGVKHGKQIVVFNDRLLKLGALMSITSDAADVADQVIDLMLNPRTGARNRPTLTPLTSMRVELNAQAASKLGLSASPDFIQFLDGD